MHIVLATVGTAGDVNPMIALGMALKERGHRTTLVTNEHFKAHVEHAGLEFIQLGTDKEYTTLLANPDLWDPVKGLETMFKGGLLPATHLLYDLLSKMDPRDTLVAAPGTCFGARLAQEKFGMPLITVHLQPAVLISVHQAPYLGAVFMPDGLSPVIKRLMFNVIDAIALDKGLGPEINAFRAKVGLAPIKHIWSRWMHSPERVIGLFPDWFAPYQPDWPPNTALTGFIRYDTGAAHTPVDPALAEFLDAGEPPIVFTPGSGMRHAHDFFETSIAAAQLLGKRALLITQHPEQVPASLPPTMRHVGYVPFSELFSRVAAVVHHGGIGTTAQTLAAGVPHLVVPFTFDQPDNAVRLERLGVGKWLTAARYKTPAVVKHLRYLLNSAEVQSKCAAFASHVNYDEALRQTCALIEQHARQISPD